MNTQDTQNTLNELQKMEQFSSQKAYANVRVKIDQMQKQKRKRRRFILSATITSAAAVVLFVFWLQFNLVNVHNTSNSPLAHTLPDGSTVEMNKYAKLSYRQNFNSGRKVKLSGEAFFDIEPDTTHPFIIKAGKSKIKVVGTSFNVRHYAKSNRVEVLVKTGTVLLSNNDTYALELSASQFGVATSQLKEVEQKDLNYMAWQDHKLIFGNNNLLYVIETIEHTYHTDIDLMDEGLSQLSLSSTFYQLSLDEIITSLCMTLNLTHEKTDKGYLLSKK